MRIVSSRFSPLNPGQWRQSGTASQQRRSEREWSAERQQGCNGTGGAARFLVLIARQQRRVDRNEGGERTPSPNRFCSALGIGKPP